MELRHLRYFDAVARHGGVGRAAQALRVAQPALSRQIRDLEQELEVTLFERTPKGVALTPAGATLQAGVRRILTAAEHALLVARRATLGREGRCILGIGRIIMSYDATSRAIGCLHRLLPDADLPIEEVMALDQPARLLDGTLDIGIGLVPEDDARLAHEPWIIADYTCAMVAASHPLAGRAELLPEDLANEPFAFTSDERAPALARLARHQLRQAGITSPLEFVYSSPWSAGMIVTTGRGWTIGPSPSTRSLPYPGLVSIPVRGLSCPVRLELQWRRDENRPLVRSVLEVLRACGDDRQPALPESRDAGGHPGLPPGLELRQLRYFAAVADDGGFGRAAERLGGTQPSLSRQVADLEHLVGAKLLERSARGTTLTDAGRVLRDGVRVVLDEVDALVGATQQARRGLVGRCVIGAVPTLAASRVIAALREACAREAPGVLLVPDDCPTPKQADALREGRIDLGICHAYPVPAPDPFLSQRAIVPDSVTCALVAPGHPLAGRASVRAAELAGFPFLFMARDFHERLYDRVFGTLRSLGLEPRVDTTYDALHVVWALVIQGTGWALNFGIQPDHPPAGMVAVPIEGLHLPWGLDVIWRRHEANPVVGRVLALLEAAYPSPIPARHDNDMKEVLEPA